MEPSKACERCGSTEHQTMPLLSELRCLDEVACAARKRVFLNADCDDMYQKPLTAWGQATIVGLTKVLEEAVRQRDIAIRALQEIAIYRPEAFELADRALSEIERRR